ncbi:hypothetical protein [Methylobacterium nigriterrae]|uniref:hypothetical protein n=1 Tax=Methylobacterium nigriterrae TaxID=3127512 RepID=UPI00301345E9
MRKSGGNLTKGWEINPQRWVDEWRRIHPVKPAQCVAENLSAPPKTVEKWFAGTSRPSFDWFGPILCVYGLGFVVGGIPAPTPWLDDAAREERRQQLLAAREDIDAKLAACWQERIGA